jgi:hypothetical protein
MERHSDRNLAVIENFILHLTHSSLGDIHYKEVQHWTPQIMYRVARDYIKEDHVDGLDNPEDEIPQYVAESSYVHEDVNKEYPENIVVVADYGDKVGTETVATITDVESVNDLIREMRGNLTASYNQK